MLWHLNEWNHRYAELGFKYIRLCLNHNVMPIYESVGGSPSKWGPCCDNHLVGMVYSDGKKDVRGKSLMGVLGESLILSLNFGGAKMSRRKLLGRWASNFIPLIRRLGGQISSCDLKFQTCTDLVSILWSCRCAYIKSKFNFMTRPPT